MINLGSFREKKHVNLPGTPKVNYRLRLKFAREGEAAQNGPKEQLAYFRGLMLESGLNCSMCDNGKFPKISVGPAITAGYESRCEYADVYLESFISNEAAKEKIDKAAGKGYSLLSVRGIPYYFPSVESAVSVTEYEITAGFENTAAPAAKLFESEKIICHAPDNTEIDIKPAVYSYNLYEGQKVLNLVLKRGMGIASKPETFIYKLFNINEEYRLPFKVMRKELYWQNSDGALQLP